MRYTFHYIFTYVEFTKHTCNEEVELAFNIFNTKPFLVVYVEFQEIIFIMILLLNPIF